MSDDASDPEDDYEPPPETIAAWLAGAVERFRDDLPVDDMDSLQHLFSP